MTDHLLALQCRHLPSALQPQALSRSALEAGPSHGVPSHGPRLAPTVCVACVSFGTPWRPVADGQAWAHTLLSAPRASSHSVAEDFFIQPTLGRRIPNSERLLRAVLDSHEVSVTRVTAAQLPLVDGRCSAEGWCLVEEGKDCRPSTWTWPTKLCEQLNTTAEQRQLYASRFESRAVVKKLKGYGSHAMDTA